MKSGILVFVEQRDGELKSAGLEALAEALRQKDALGGDVSAVLVGSGLETATECIAACGVSTVYRYDHDGLGHYVPEVWRACVLDAAEKSGAGAILLGATSMGRELGGAVAGALDAGYAADCTGLDVVDGEFVARRPVYAGKAVVTVTAKTDHFVLSLRPNAFDGTLSAGAAATVETPDLPLDPANARVRVTAIKKADGGKKDVLEADVIVSGGRGTGGPDGWGPLEDLASAFDGAVGASRAVVDLGWRPHAEQVGQTGKVVAPKLYFAAGISGAIQHLAGMRTSKVIVAINKDAEAPIFKVADYGIVGDLHEVLPALTEAVKAARG